MDKTNSLKINFNEIKNLRESVENLLKSLGDKINTLNNIYKYLITNNMNETENGLDSLHFQSKLINYEVENNYEIFNMIDNHMYCNYYKLYKHILKYLDETISNKNITSGFLNKNYPVYKDLDIHTKYDFEIIIEIYNTIIQIIDILYNEYMAREHKFYMENNRKKTGLNIDNLVNSLHYNNENMKNNINLFVQYLIIFNGFHSKYLTRFSLRTKLLYGQINNDIHLEESKNNVDYSNNNDNISLENDEEFNMRDLIYSCSNIQEQSLQKLELDNIISGINISPQISNSSDIPTNNTNDACNNIVDVNKTTNNINKTPNNINKTTNNVNNNTNNINNNTNNENKTTNKSKIFISKINKDNELEYNINNCIIL